MKLDHQKYADGLIPAIIQDANTNAVLMLGFMNAEAVDKTRATGLVTFFSRSRRQLWTKGQTSGNYLRVVSISADCDDDTLLIKARPDGPICHLGTKNCFGTDDADRHGPVDLLAELENIIDHRRREKQDDSYVSRLFEKGINKIAQKVGEEAVELVIEAKDDDPDRFRSEAADLLFHYLVLLRAKDVSINEVISELADRRK